MNDAQETSADKLALELSRFVANGNTIAFSELVPLLRKLLGKSDDVQYSPYALLALLLARPEPEANPLALRIHSVIMAEALRMARVRQANPTADWQQSPLLAHLPPEMPVGWRNDTMAFTTLKQVVQLQRDHAFLQSKAPDLSGPLNTIATALTNHLTILQKTPVCWSLIPVSQLWTDFSLPPDTSLPSSAFRDSRADEDTYLKELVARVTENPGQGLSPALKELVAWPAAAAAEYLHKICVASPTRQAFVMQALALRTQLEYTSWTEWGGWLKRTSEAFAQLRTEAALLTTQFKNELRLLWLRQQADISNPALIANIEAAAVLSAEHDTDPGEFVRRWDYALMPSEASRFVKPLQVPPIPKQQPTLAKPELPMAVAAKHVQPPPLKAAHVIPPPVKVVEVKLPPQPTIWDSHIQPFLTANWYIIAGLLMVVAGASLLAYFTWDKSAFVRYLFLPLILGAFTAGLAELGLRLARRHEELRVTGSFLLGGAVCLLPVNFIVLCRAGADPLAARFILPALGLYVSGRLKKLVA